MKEPKTIDDLYKIIDDVLLYDLNSITNMYAKFHNVDDEKEAATYWRTRRDSLSYEIKKCIDLAKEYKFKKMSNPHPTNL